MGEHENFSIEAVENTTSYSTALEDLKPETNYMIQVYAQTMNSPVSSPAPWDFITPAGGKYYFILTQVSEGIFIH